MKSEGQNKLYQILNEIVMDQISGVPDAIRIVELIHTRARLVKALRELWEDYKRSVVRDGNLSRYGMQQTISEEETKLRAILEEKQP